MEPILVLIGAVAASFVMAVLFGQTIVSFRKHCSTGLKAKQSIATIAFMLIAALLWAGAVDMLSTQTRSDDGSSSPRLASIVAQEPTTDEWNGDTFPAVNLTANQVKTFLKDYSLEFSSNSIASRKDERIEAIRKYKEEFTDPVSFPMESWLDQLDTILSADLSETERQTQLEQLRHDLNQSIISNPVIGDMWAQALMTLDPVTEENPWIEEFLQLADEYYARPEPTQSSDPPCGLSAFVKYANTAKTKMVVTDEYATFAAKLCKLLEEFEFQYVTERTSARNWRNTDQTEDSASRTEEAAKQDNRAALLMVYTDDESGDTLEIGINLYDQRAMIYGQGGEPGPQPTPPPPYRTPQPTPTPEPTPGIIPKPSHTLTIYYVFKDGGTAAPTYTNTYKEGEGYSVRSPGVTGYTPVTSLVSGTMGKKDLVFTVYYTRDGAGLKDPDADPVNQGNAPINGGENLPSDKRGEVQEEEPPRHDYGNGDQSTGQDRNDLDQNGNSTVPLTPADDKESSGTHGVDHSITDANDGATFGGDIPEKTEIPVNNGTTITDNNTSNVTSTPQETNTGEIAPPPD